MPTSSCVFLMSTTPCSTHQTHSSSTAIVHSDGMLPPRMHDFPAGNSLAPKGLLPQGQPHNHQSSVLQVDNEPRNASLPSVDRQKRTAAAVIPEFWRERQNLTQRQGTTGSLLDKSKNDMVAVLGCTTSSRRCPLERIHQPHKPACFAHTRERTLLLTP